MNICLTVLMGLPGSGKTTFAETLRNLYKHHNGKYFTFVHVCYDELLPFNVLEVQENETKYKDMRTDILHQVHQLLTSVMNGNFDNCPNYFKIQLDMHFFNSVIVILIDDNMYLKSMRYAFYKLAKDFNISFCQVYLKSPLEQCLERNFSRASNSIVPVTVISDMNAKLEPPRVDNKWEKHTLVFQTDDDYNKLYSDYFELLDKALENPESIQDENDLVEKEKSVFICMTNVLHQSDIALRQIVSNKIQNSHLKSKPDEKKEFQLYCTKLNNTKGKILNDIKLGIINIPEVVLTEIKENMLEKTSLKLFIEQIFDSHLSGN